jgi:type I restriction enzyme S subunit
VTELPSGWAWATLPDLVAGDGVFSDGDWVETKDQDPGGDVRLTQLADVGEGVFRNRSSRFMTAEAAERLGCTYLEPGDVLVARMPDPLGRACLYPGGSTPAVTAVDVCILRPGSGSVNPRWLMWWLNTPQFREEVAGRQSGTTRKRISRKNLGAICFPVPPVAEQRRIAAVIEEHLSRLEAAERSLADARSRITTYRSAILSAATDHYETVDLDELVTELRYGTSVKCSYDAAGPPVVRIPNVQGGVIDLSDLKYATDERLDLSPISLRSGDLLFVRTNGSRDLIGRVASVDGAEGMAFASYLIRARPDPARLDSRFAVIALSAPKARAAIESKAATTAGQYNLNLAALRSLRTPLPSIEQQRSIVAEVEHRLTAAVAMEAEIDRALRQSAALRRAILARASRGELVQQDPDDEPASVLLERIAAERAAAPKPTRRARMRTAA